MAATVVPLGPAQVDLTGVRAGDKNEITMTVTKSGVPFNLSGATVLAQARKAATDVGPPALTAEIDVTNPVGGALTLRWPGDAVRTLLGASATWSGVWDLQVQAVDEDPVTICGGKFAAEVDVTR